MRTTAVRVCQTVNAELRRDLPSVRTSQQRRVCRGVVLMIRASRAARAGLLPLAGNEAGFVKSTKKGGSGETARLS